MIALALSAALLAPLPAATAAPLLGAAPETVVVVSAAGFADVDAGALLDRAEREVAQAGFRPWALGRSVQVHVDCVVDVACVRSLLQTAHAETLVAVDVLRAGGRATVGVRVLDAAGVTVASSGGAVGVADLASTPLLTAELVAVLRARAAAAPGGAPIASDALPRATPSAKLATPGALSPPAVAGLAVGAVGGVLLVGGTAVALSQTAVLLDPSADGVSRERTAITIPTAVATSVVGVVGGVVGAFLFGTNLGGDA